MPTRHNIMLRPRLLLLLFTANVLVFVALWNSSRLSSPLISQQSLWAPRENATFVSLVPNHDLNPIMETIRAMEDRFNHKYHYDWVFLNDVEFTEEFVNQTSYLVSGKTHYGVVPKEFWSYPSWIDQARAAKVRDEMRAENIIYGDSESYRFMCRFESGLFYRHEIMKQFRYYWRVEPYTRILCDINYDPFKFMRENNKIYGFVIALYEYGKTIPTLWEKTMEFLSLYPQYRHDDNLMDFISDDDGKTYNLCHFWSNFEIADADFWRSNMYSQYFNFLDKAGGFFYERWGDAPVHSLAASLFLSKNQIHFFEDIGYLHPPYQHVPSNFMERDLKCGSAQSATFDWDGYSCMRQYYRAMNWTIP